MKKILAIGGSAVKNCWGELRTLAENGEIEMLIHNGASLFHDFQLVIDDELRERGITSYPLEQLVVDYRIEKEASDLVWKWIRGDRAPYGSLTRMCQDSNIPVLC